MELLSQGISASEAEPDYATFLADVRKEKLSLLLFGIPIPNADLERVIAYYRKAKGRVTTGDIAKAWQYRDIRAEQLSFRLRGSLKTQYILAQVYMVFCLLAAAGGFVVWQTGSDASQLILLVCVSLLALVITSLINQGLFTAARLAGMEKEKHRSSSAA